MICSAAPPHTLAAPDLKPQKKELINLTVMTEDRRKVNFKWKVTMPLSKLMHAVCQQMHARRTPDARQTHAISV